MTEKRLALAMQIATRAPDDHPFQVGIHALHSSLGMEGLTLALIHDSVEDGYLRKEEYESFPYWLREALTAITRLQDEPYTEYIERLRRGPLIAILVKLSDLKVNLERSLASENTSLIHRYERAIERLSRFQNSS